ncbi:senescence-induced receptor-like serine/threonine-protein kinase [Cinnamomum micranthum f. kanehirae]|uniref:non-specific serine/threonine protein kinase n=1 Tax=Cinnamomum micranthum f. kanehirae TaxID=337451 RepID=A0A443NI18_9MAGN|nr:senescence-induced receptor-like serine/threonine-protein kinase [Cinnamomum micranthum f. kanehirae]
MPEVPERNCIRDRSGEGRVRCDVERESFISIDCGIANDLTYIDSDNITYISDFQFIETGVNENVRIPADNLRRFYRTVRSFPNGNRNCYNLGSVNMSNKYFIRAYFMYGDYDGKNSTPEFDLHIGVNLWNTVSLSDATSAFYVEIITIATMNFISVCLVNTGYGTPFISALELRPLNNSMYSVVNESQSLMIEDRFDFGRSSSSDDIRYPEDPFDLIWEPKEDTSWISFNTTQNVTNKDGAIEPLSTVMMTAVRPINDSATLNYSWTADDSSTQFHVYMHFAELELLSPNTTREFTVCCGSNSCGGGQPLRPEYLVTTTIQTPQPLSGQYDYSCTFKKTPKSNRPPILNAIEPFTIVPHSAIPTRELDGMDLSWNNLTGPIPNFLGDLHSLSLLNLSGNQLSGLVPSNLLEKSKKGSLKLSVDNNPDLCVSDSCGRHSNKGNVIVLVVAPVASLVILLILLIILWRFKWRKQELILQAKKVGGSFRSENRRFTYTEVLIMTNNFERAIGKGGFGTVYHGQMPDGTQVAVKMLSIQSVKLLSHTFQGYDEFQNEVQLLTRVHHRNLVPFIGYCQEGDGTALIYEYMAQGNLGSHLLGTNSNTKALNWGQRLRIALDIAQGLEYLHTGCKPAIIHRDMKTTNILLNERFEAKIGDFGLSKVFFKDDEQTHISTLVKGTPGYLDPEYFHSNNLTQKSDVYGFGVVLLELITGQPPIIRCSTNYEKRNLVDWASPLIATRDVQVVLDPRLEGDFDANSLSKIAEIALACTSPRSIERPTMTDIVAELKDCLGTEIAAEISCSSEIGQVGTMSSYSSEFFPR